MPTHKFGFVSGLTRKMQVGIATSEDNPNHSWLSARGGWVSYTLGVILLHVVIRTIPLVHGPYAWTLTNVVHNVVSQTFLMLLVCRTNLSHLSAYVYSSPYAQRRTVVDIGSRRKSSINSLGTNRLRYSIYGNAKVLDSLSYRLVSLSFLGDLSELIDIRSFQVSDY